MRLTKRGEYALRAMIDLGMAAEAGREVVRISEIAKHESIPLKFLEAILVQLKDMGYLGSKRGKSGGYFLARPADAISIGEVMRNIEGPLAPVGCVSRTRYEKCSCPDEEHCGLRMLMSDVRNAIANVLDQYTLSEIVRTTVGKMKRGGVSLPFAKPT